MTKAEYQAQWRANNPERLKKYKARERKKYRAKYRKYALARYYRDRERLLVVGKTYRDTLRAEFLMQYGGICACCGEKNPAFLTLEHIGGLRGRKRKSATHEFRRLKVAGWPKGEVEILCANCNKGRAEYGTCPHLT